MLEELESETKNADTWKKVLEGERGQPYFKELINSIEMARQGGKLIYPKNIEIFAALKACPFEQVKVVILGQDPYHGPGQAHGLCFSVQPGTEPPPSLKNIYKELNADLGLAVAKSGCLLGWAQQGVLLLNSVLTVEANKPASHANLGWEKLTDKIIGELSTRKTGLVFMLWGAYAQKKGAQIDQSKHLILKAAHPSPFSAHNGFFGSRHFSKANSYLIAQGRGEVDWRVDGPSQMAKSDSNYVSN